MDGLRAFMVPCGPLGGCGGWDHFGSPWEPLGVGGQVTLSRLGVCVWDLLGRLWVPFVSLGGVRNHFGPPWGIIALKLNACAQKRRPAPHPESHALEKATQAYEADDSRRLSEGSF